MFSDDAAMILRDIERQLQDATDSGRKPKEAFLLVLSQACLDLALDDWGPIQDGDYISAIWDFVNKEMARVEALEKPETSAVDKWREIWVNMASAGAYPFAETLDVTSHHSNLLVFEDRLWHEGAGQPRIEANKYLHSEMGIFEGKQYTLTFDPDQYLYTVEWRNGVDKVRELIFKQDVLSRMDCRLFTHRLIGTKIGIFPTTPPIPPTPPEDDQTSVDDPAPPAPAPYYPYGVSPTVTNTTTQPTDEAGNAAAAPAPKSAETDDFLKGPSTLTKNILKDWGHL